MQARGCQPVSESASFLPVARTRALPVVSTLLAVFLSACAPTSPSKQAPAVTQSKAAHSTSLSSRAGPESLAKIAPPPVRADKLQDPLDAMHEHLYELEMPEVDQQGIASWYGPGFHGRKTANGERFNQYELTAAHPTYKFGTQLCVRSKSTGQAVVVRVNDRGPFAKNRVIDLSKAAAQELGMLSRGVKAVEIYKLDDGQEDCPEALMQAKG
ncbi:septal ring lytic transglycosylase RlpA family protein [Comamonas sp. NoAH]|uniref:septal ring lytic transglycosylase RlpA family protein n=1 Tax=Comamonas halotolerans TaxID=3041496 RepID=UPI0024E0C8E9|nr:septal ring lytic transglycosylase RlpA family protein [Comamonas sp. NoAH]